ncbi:MULTISPECIES: hypothetical protein [unclassified Achromobacter]|uniref:hypothetical protein n=1 Tax=unclassified Achromobacter TaxID=2626865 RepID=UPI00069D94D3|nr:MULTISPECIES: hypothetical protein [unclassified Achromobacter]KOF54200.1 hypothetical protein AD428_08560 [Achromobacter sp. DMS1]
MNPEDFVFHDLSRFPIVTARGGRPGGYAQGWIREMEMLVDNPCSFVLVVPNLQQDMAQEDRKAMVAWQTENMPRLRARCRAFVGVERNPQAREKTRQRGEKMSRAFGMPFLVVATAEEAVQCARELLGQSGPGGFNVT